MKLAAIPRSAWLQLLLTGKPDMDAVVMMPPMGKQREGGRGHRFTPAATAAWMRNARDQLWYAWHPRAPIGLNEPVCIEIEAVMDRENWSAADLRDGPAGRCVNTDKPDNDNIEKIVFDSMIRSSDQPNGLARFVLADDKAIVTNFTAKYYAATGEAPHVRVRLFRWKETR